LVTRASWPTSDTDNVWVEVAEELQDTLCSEFLPIVSVENFGVTNHAKYLLEFVGNQTGLLPREGTDKGQSGGMILSGHYPAH
jgi:hypothetical protein